MKWDGDTRILELSARNVRALTEKLDDPQSARTLVSPCSDAVVRAVEDLSAPEESLTPAGISGILARTVNTGRPLPMTVVLISREDLARLAAPGERVVFEGITVVSVPDEDHYSDRAPGEVYMPTSGQQW